MNKPIIITGLDISSSKITALALEFSRTGTSAIIACEYANGHSNRNPDEDSHIDIYSHQHTDSICLLAYVPIQSET